MRMEKILKSLRTLRITDDIVSSADLFYFCLEKLKEKNYNLFQLLIYPDSPVLSLRSPSLNCAQTTIFHVACGIHNMSQNVLENLLTLGLNINAQNDNGETPLHITLLKEIKLFKVSQQFNDVPQDPDPFRNTMFLIKHGSDLQICNKFNHTPVDCAVISGCLEAVEIFIGEPVPKDEPRLLYIIKSLLKKKYFTLTSHRLLLLLEFSIINKDSRTFRVVIKKAKRTSIEIKTDGKIRDEILCLAASKGDPKFIEILKDEGVDDYSYIAFYYAVESKNLKNIRYFLKLGMPNNDLFDTAYLNAAINMDSIELVKIVLGRGANVNAFSNNLTPLMTACRGKDNVSMVKFLIARGAHIETRDCNDRTALSHACLAGNFLIMSELLDRGATIDDINLHYAVLGKNPQAVDLCLVKNISINCVIEKYGTPLEVAMFRCIDDESAFSVLVKTIARMLLCKHHVSKRNRKLFKYKRFKKTLQIYKKEFRRMEEKKINQECGFSFLDIFTKHIDVLGYATKDLNLVLNEREYQREFKTYASELQSSMTLTIIRRRIIEKIHKFFEENLEIKIPIEIILRIFKDFSIEKLESFLFIVSP